MNEETKKIIGGQEVILHNLDKVFWPKEKITKGDLIEYYQKISRWILPYLKDRPQSLNRFPNGINGESFFQKDMEYLPRWVKNVKIHSEKDDKIIKYMLCQNEAALIYMINLGVIEINPWNSRIGSLKKPDYLVFDIDPAGIPFSAAVKVARETKKVLDKLGLISFCKTSGSRGLHIYVPTRAKYSYHQAKDFVQLVNSLVNKNLPEITSLERNPKKRQQKVYLDYLQNREGQTMASPYSIRPRPGAPVSTPLFWQEVNVKLNPAKFNIKTIFGRLKNKKDPWKGFFKTAANLQKALKILEKIHP